MVVGGAGYIGAHLVSLLSRTGTEVTVVDDLSTGVAGRVATSRLLIEDVTSAGATMILASAMREMDVDTIYHFAARKAVDESVSWPLSYYRSNLEGLANVLKAAVKANVERFVFSSSAAVYGETEDGPVAENSRTSPINPYGRSKLAGEWLVRDVRRAHGIKTASLRYFNVAGTSSSVLSDLGRSNLIPSVLSLIKEGTSPQIFGNDYDTPDGTCIRDYIHVEDLVEAHQSVANSLDNPDSPTEFNVGVGRGYSVAEVVHRAIEITGSEGLEPAVFSRRAGDPSSVVADIQRIQATGWRARRSLSDMLTSSWAAMAP